MAANITNLKRVEGNVEGAPEGSYVSYKGYSDRTPYMITRISESGATVWVREIECVETEEWLGKMVSYPGGFCRHVANQYAQTHKFVGLIGPEKAIKIGSAKDWYFSGGKPFRFYDYNF